MKGSFLYICYYYTRILSKRVYCHSLYMPFKQTAVLSLLIILLLSVFCYLFKGKVQHW